jgi:uncharacterized membrane protein YphA (DoxX/SURF4 family)
MTPNERIRGVSRVFLRVALGVTFLVSCADRFGFVGAYGSKNVSWGDWKHFEDYVAVLNWFLPKAAIPALAAVETVIEVILGLALLVGIYLRVTSWCSAALLLLFALTMTCALGIVAPISYSVFTAVGGALLLAATAPPGAFGRASHSSLSRQ